MDIVVMMDQKNVRSHYPLARVIEVMPDDHGVVHNLCIRTPKSNIYYPKEPAVFRTYVRDHTKVAHVEFPM